MKASAKQLLGRAVDGDRDALVDLLGQHGPAVRKRLAGRIPRRWQSVLSEDDVMQQTYANAAAGISQFNSDKASSFVDWLTTIAQRNLADALRMLKAEKRGGDRLPFVLDDTMPGTGTTPSGHLASAERMTALRQAIKQLPETYARVVTMYDLEDRPVEEVAEAMQRSPGAVFMLRARAHDRLHELMGRTSKFFGDSE